MTFRPDSGLNEERTKMTRAGKFQAGTAAAAIASGLVAAAPVSATETISYSYDAQGRLTRAARSGSVNNGLTTQYQHDAADNRTSRWTGTGPPPAPPPAPPPPPPPPANNPPATVADTLSVARCATGSKNVVANDSDPEGNLPLALVDVSPGIRGSATVLDASTVQYEAFDSTGTDPLTYTVQDSLGASSTGTLTVTVTSGVCQ